MKVREKLMRKVMAVVIAAATIFSISGGMKVVPVKAAGEVAEVLDNNGISIAKYATFEAAASNVYNNYTIKMLADATESCSVDIANKNLTIDLNGKNLTITQISTMNALTIKNGSMSAEINNANSGNSGTLVVDNVNLTLPTGMEWFTNDGMQIKNGSYVDLLSGKFTLVALAMDYDCVFSVSCDSGIFNYGNITNGFDGIKKFVPEGYSVGIYSSPNMTDTPVTVLDKNGNRATNFVLRYRRLSDPQLSVTLDPDTYVYDGNEKKPAVTVIYDGQTLTENTSYTLTYADNKNAGTASVTINGKNSLHGQIVKNFTIQKADQNAPMGLTPTAETIDGKNDGQITNLATTMEYSVDQTSWTACTGTTLTQLSDGDYYVRYKETNNYYASPSTKVVVAKGATPSTTGEQTTTEKQTTGEQATTQQTSVEQPDGATTQQTSVEQPDGATTQAGVPKTTEADKKTDKAVSTGDAYPIAIMITLMLGAGVGITGMIRRRKEK